MVFYRCSFVFQFESKNTSTIMPSYLVAGASRGIGLALVKRLSAEPSTSIVYAGVRTPETALLQLESDPKIRILKLDVLSQADVDAAATAVETETGSLDVLIINAGAGATQGAVAQSDTDDLQAIVNLNTVAPHRVIQAFLPLIRKGHIKKIIAVGSAGGTFGIARGLVPAEFPVGPYGVSKAGLHFLIMLYGVELASEGIVTASIHPGMVDTDGSRLFFKGMGELARAKIEQMGVKLLSTKECVDGMIRVINGLSVEQSGNLLGLDGSTMPF